MSQNTVSGSSGEYAVADRTVLFVDDEARILDLLELMVGDQFDVRTANSGRQALEMFDDEIDVAFFDRQMPDMNGMDVIAELRERGYETPIAILSGVEQDPTVERDYRAYLTKPVTAEEITGAVETLAR